MVDFILLVYLTVEEIPFLKQTRVHPMNSPRACVNACGFSYGTISEVVRHNSSLTEAG